jgi:hypothetical protein
MDGALVVVRSHNPIKLALKSMFSNCDFFFPQKCLNNFFGFFNYQISRFINFFKLGDSTLGFSG